MGFIDVSFITKGATVEPGIALKMHLFGGGQIVGKRASWTENIEDIAQGRAANFVRP